MCALINRLIPLIFLSATHEIARRDRLIGRGHPSQGTGAGPAENARKCTANARVHLFERRVHFAAGVDGRQGEAAKLDAAIARNLKELAYGG